MSVFLLVVELLSILVLAASTSISMPGCVDRCGDVKIPYPFGIGPSCYHNKSYEILCDASFHPAKPYLASFNLEVLEITWPFQWEDESNSQTLTVNIPPRDVCDKQSVSSYDFRGSPYRYSRWLNDLVVEGCGAGVVVKDKSGQILTGCASICGDDASNSMNETGCYGVGCCQASLVSSPKGSLLIMEDGLELYQVGLDSAPLLSRSNSCRTTATLIKRDSVRKFVEKSSNLQTFPTVLEWRATYKSTFEDSGSFSYYNATSLSLQRRCNFPYQGNPYVPYGCQVIDECRGCSHRCFKDNNPTGSGSHYHCKKNLLLKWATITGFSIALGFLLFVLCGYTICQFVTRRTEIRQKAEHFKRNGGLLLQQQMSSKEGIVQKARVFTIIELQKATDNFNENRILGHGGQGTVYKGMLMDGRIVAIKKSKKMDESQIEPFINEVLVLSQINHRNVVGLLGCCLESEVPMLVYEFIPNGTLYEHINGQSDDFHVNWKMRLQIAAESAGAIAYLHSSSSTPIYHRDIKSTNILLDEKYRAKVSDFGTSRCITIEQTHVTTSVQGTYGYLDPEYFRSNQFTEKSDVYSFGVVLVELLTGKKPICPIGNGSWLSLAIEFLSQMEDSRLSDILDTRISDEGSEEDFMAVAQLATECLNMNGKQRPTMKEVALVLDGIRLPRVPVLKERYTAQSDSFSRYTSFLEADTEVDHSLMANN